MKIIKTICLSGLLLANTQLFAQYEDAIRGGWIADIDSTRHIYVFVIKDQRITGVYCHNDCHDPVNLAFIDDGTIEGSTLSFNLYQESTNGVRPVSQITANLQGQELHISNDDQSMILVRSPVDDRAAAPPGGFGPPPPPYIPPADFINVTSEAVAGLWLFGSGPGKQYFIFKKHKDGLRGMVCGPCTDASNMAPIENIRINGTELFFDIVHENSGPGILEHGPHTNITRASISRNEMHIWVVPSFEGEDYPAIEMTMLGPVAFQP